MGAILTFDFFKKEKECKQLHISDERQTHNDNK